MSLRHPSGPKLDGSATLAQLYFDDKDILATMTETIPGWNTAWNEYLAVEESFRVAYLEVRFSLEKYPREEWRMRERRARRAYYEGTALERERWLRWKCKRTIKLATRRSCVKLRPVLKGDGNDNGKSDSSAVAPGACS